MGRLTKGKKRFMFFCIFVLLLITTFYSFSCSHATPEDLRKLDILKKNYGNEFVFELESQIYLRVYCKKKGLPVETKMIEIYKTFFWDEAIQNIRHSSFIYLNLYDSMKEFQYQLAYDSSKRKYIKSFSDHY